MGPLASAAFVASIYRASARRPEQEQPALLLRSSPGIPDRTGMLLAGQGDELAALIEAELASLVEAGAERLVICCVTAHAVVPALPEAQRRRLLSLLDVLFGDPALEAGRWLVVATNGTRRVGLLESHAGYTAARGRLSLPEGEAQERIHELIYALKAGASVGDAAARLSGVAREAKVDGVIAACTEVHMLGEELERLGLGVVDPLATLARRGAAW